MLNVRRMIVTQAGRSIRRQQEAFRRVDISSPTNVLLDMESLGRNTRETNFSLFPAAPLGSVVDNLVRDDKELHLIANLMNRAVDVIEESDEQVRAQKRKELQSVIFSKWVKFFASKTGYSIFGIFNRKTFESVSSKIHPDKREMVVKLISQPLLRIAALRRDISLDPNQVMAFTGVDGFRSIMDRFSKNLALLSGKNLDRLLNGMRSARAVHFEILDVWFRFWSPEIGLKKPVVKNSAWTLERLLKEIERKQSKPMLVELLVKCELRDEVVRFLRQRHSFTGMAKFPWSFAVIDEWMIERRLLGELGESVSTVTIVSSSQAPTHIEEHAVTTAKPRVQVEFVDTDQLLTKVKKSINASSDLVGISFVTDSLISVSTRTNAFVIDLESVNSVFVGYFLKRILNDTKTFKVVYSLDALLNKLQTSLGMKDLVHFENVVDLRRGRVKRTLGLREKSSDELEVILPDEINFPDESVNSVKPTVYENIQHVVGGSSLSELASTYLGFDHDRSRIYENPELWSIRPLDPDLLQIAVFDSFSLVLLEDHFRQEGFHPTEVLTFDPFS